MVDKVDLNKYSAFVEAVTSKTSEDLTTYTERLDELNTNMTVINGERVYGPEINVPLLITGAMGLCGESGELIDIVKKTVFHNKPFTVESKEHANRELGDIFWYWTNTCRALGLNPNQVIADNVAKLTARYPGGVFSVFASENRKLGDV